MRDTDSLLIRGVAATPPVGDTGSWPHLGTAWSGSVRSLMWSGGIGQVY